VMDAALRPVTAFQQMVGRARTVRCRDDFLAVIQAQEVPLAAWGRGECRPKGPKTEAARSPGSSRLRSCPAAEWLSIPPTAMGSHGAVFACSPPRHAEQKDVVRPQQASHHADRLWQ